MKSQTVIIEFANGSTARFRGPPQVNTARVPKIRRVSFTVPKNDGPDETEFNFFDMLYKTKGQNQ